MDLGRQGWEGVMSYDLSVYFSFQAQILQW